VPRSPAGAAPVPAPRSPKAPHAVPGLKSNGPDVWGGSAVADASATLELSVSAEGGETVVAATGELDVTTAPELRERLTALIGAGSTTILLDLAGVTFVDSTALSVLVAALKRLRQADGD